VETLGGSHESRFFCVSLNETRPYVRCILIVVPETEEVTVISNSEGMHDLYEGLKRG
jgi:hypothetical protein